jgi:hypothetical protein
VLGVGIGWAEEFHLVALGRPGEGVFEVARVEHTPADINRLVARIAGIEADPAEVRVVLETSHGMLVEPLLDAGYVVVPVNPDLVARRRGPAKKKGNVADARIACHIALDRFERLRPLLPHGEEAAELRAIAREDERAARDERRLLQQWAFCSLGESAWAREFYDAQRAGGKSHNGALRALGNRWLEVLWHCLSNGVPYDESTHVANRNRALGRAPGTAA